MTPAAARLGILGGTFDPAHLGHLASAREVAEAFALARVLMIPAARPPHKPEASPAPIEDRLAMLGLLVGDDPLFEVSRIEAERPGPSYTYDTLAHVAHQRPHDAVYLVLGVDAYREIDAWYRPAEVLELANIVVTSRPGEHFPPGALQPPVAARDSCCYDSTIGCYVHSSGHTVIAHTIRGLEVSSSDIRRRVREGLPVEHLTGPAIARFIEHRHLYGADSR